MVLSERSGSSLKRVAQPPRQSTYRQGVDLNKCHPRLLVMSQINRKKGKYWKFQRFSRF